MFIIIDFLFFTKHMNTFISFIIIFYLIIKSDTIITIDIVFEYIYFNRVFQQYLYDLNVLFFIEFNKLIFI